MKEDFRRRRTTFLSICLLLAFNNYFGNSTDEVQLKRCCNESSSTQCRDYCHSYLDLMNGTDACVTHFNRIMKCNIRTVNRTQCCQTRLKGQSWKCFEFCTNYDKWIANFTNICGEERQSLLLCFVETAVPDVPPTIINKAPDLRYLTIKSNEKKTIECEARGKPNVTYNWTKNGNPLPDKHNRTLELRDSDEGVYQCSATNEHGTDLSDFTHLLKTTNHPVRNPDAPFFGNITDGPYNIIVTEGCNATFRCNATADPKASIQWLQNGKAINAINRPERFEFSSDLQTLTIRNVCRDCGGGKSDLMVIQCNASNPHGYVFRSGTLNVLKKTKVTTDNVTEVVAPADAYTNTTVCCRAVSDAVVSLGTRLTWYRKREDGGCSTVPDYQRGHQNGSHITAYDNTLVIRIEANDSAAWTRLGGEYVCVGQHRSSRHEQVVTVNPNARVELKLDVLTTTDEKFQKRAVFVCSFSYEKTGKVTFGKFRWYLNNTEILNPISQTISDIDLSGDSVSSNRTINLTFPSIPPLYSGNRVRCVVEYLSQMNFSIYRERSLPVVHVHPEVSIKSSAYDVRASQNFTLTCTVTNFDQINATEVTFQWYQDHKEDSRDGSNSSTLTKSWSLKEEKSPVVFGCSAMSRYLPSVIQNASIAVIKDEVKVCAENTDSVRNITWPQTRTGGTARRQCNKNETGECTRLCSINSGGTEPKWSDPDCTKCVNPKLTSILQTIGNFENAISNNNRTQVANVVKSLSDFTNDTTQGLQIGDLSGSVEAVSRLVRLQKKNEGQPPKKEEVEWAVQIISNLLEPTNEDSWKSLRETNKSAAATLMALGDSYGEGLTQIINGTGNSTPVTKATDQVVLEAFRKKFDNDPQSFAFPSSNDIAWVESSDQISLDVYKNNTEPSKHDNSLSVWSLYYRNLNEFLPNESDYVLNSRVLSLSVAELLKNNTHLTENVTVTLQHVLNITAEKRERKCAYWKFNSEDSRNGSWVSDAGCTVVASQSNENQTVCSCNHLTNFAILMSKNPSHDDALSIISKIGCAISVIALALTIIIYAVTWKQVKSHQAAVLLNLCIALLIAYLVFLLGADKVHPEKGACTAVAVLLHYFFLAAFFLMLAEGVQLFICVYFVFHVRQRRETAGLIVAGWVLPLIIVAVSLGAKQTAGYGGEKACWLTNDEGLIWAFAGPVFAIIAINVVIIVAVLRKIVCSRVVSSKKKDNDNSKIRKMAWSVAVLCPVLGIAWLFGVLSIATKEIVFEYIFTIVNSFQGLFIFIFHGLYNNKKSSEKISSFVSEVISRTPFKRRLDTTTTSSSAPSGAAGKASLASKDVSQDNKEAQADSFTDTGGKEGNPYSDFASTELLEPKPSEVSTPVHTDSTTTQL